MQDEVKIVLLSTKGSAYVDELSSLLIDVVEDGASIGFLPPLSKEEAAHYWDAVWGRDVKVWIAVVNGSIAGTVQLHLCGKPNGRHRAEIAKLMTHPKFRRMGIGRALMEAAEAAALEDGRSLLFLDTREGDPSNRLYAAMGYIEAGRIPGYAMSANGELHATILYYKPI